ncbi:MAG: Lrp/AsnC family transcriptional regulator [Gammaproteobacteria bacterium]
MTPMDTKILGLLIKDGRSSFAEIARILGISRAHARERVSKLMDDGVIEQFTAVVNPEKLGKAVANSLSQQPEVISLYIMNDMQSLHMHTLTEDMDVLERFANDNLFSREHIQSVDCKTLLSRLKHRRGGPRL